jgi:hypothetical protein
MRKNAPPRFNTRVQLSVLEGREIYALALKENRSQSATVSLLLREALEQRRSTTASTQQLVAMLKGTGADAAS